MEGPTFRQQTVTLRGGRPTAGKGLNGNDPS
jgi:hypothetical protein